MLRKFRQVDRLKCLFLRATHFDTSYGQTLFRHPLNTMHMAIAFLPFPDTMPISIEGMFVSVLDSF
ncbi:hypothetical protein [[Leptolyngbya] sp. PCC 7376]|uniref:hypothetical protein n=1 Tax=[Leptolyngbya] sp. PCC 7376 TaxID=111781 RepID=UPI0003181E42|nr:hypothetical protein [[Leptolyngbya] sp. PCC 7376]